MISLIRVYKPVAKALQTGLPIRLFSSQVNRQRKVNFNTKHLEKGDPLPPYNGKLRVYNFRYCPFAQRTLLALIVKDLDFEVINVNLENKPEWLVMKSPLEKVPVLEIKEGVCLPESLVTVEYLDEVYHQRPLLPKDPVRRAEDKFIVEFSSLIANLFTKIVKKPDAISDSNITGYHKGLNFIEQQIKKRGSKFLHGDQPGYVDYMIWPWFERVWALYDVDSRMHFDTQKHSILVEYIETMLQDHIVQKYIVPKNIIIDIMEGYKPGKTPYFDVLLEKE